MRIFFLLLLLTTQVHAREIYYTGDPVPVQLGSREVRVRFPAAVEYRSIRAPISITNTGRDLLLRRTGNLNEPVRLLVREIQSRDVYLLDLIQSDQSAKTITLLKHRPAENSQSHPYVLLTRFAAQKFYAPQRLQTTIPGIIRLAPPKEDFRWIYRGSQLLISIEARWRWNSLELLAVRAQNQTAESIEIDPRNFRGSWLAATAQHAVLGPAGSQREQTMLYMIRRAQ